MPEPNVSTCQDVGMWQIFCPLLVLYNMSVAGVRVVEFGTNTAIGTMRKMMLMMMMVNNSFIQNLRHRHRHRRHHHHRRHHRQFLYCYPCACVIDVYISSRSSILCPLWQFHRWYFCDVRLHYAGLLAHSRTSVRNAFSIPVTLTPLHWQKLSWISINKSYKKTWKHTPAVRRTKRKKNHFHAITVQKSHCNEICS